MKTFVLIGLLTTGLSAVAGVRAPINAPAAAAKPAATQPTDETRRLIAVLVKNPIISQELNKNDSALLESYTITNPKQGIFNYELKFIRSCFCIPQDALVSIEEDVTPTYVDGAPIYKSSIRFVDPSKP